MSAINNEQKDANTNEEETYKYTEGERITGRSLKGRQLANGAWR